MCEDRVQKLSFIVPCFNAERYVQRCLDSLYQCGLPETQYEIICVDDCSCDETVRIIEGNCTNHPNVILLRHENNMKAGGARNTGLRAAKGKYIWFVDSDDCILNGAARCLMEHCDSHDLDTLSFNMFCVDETGDLRKEIVFRQNLFMSSGIDFLEKVFGKDLVCHMGFPWRTVYRRSLLLENNVLFPSGMLFGEDTTYMAEAIGLSKKTGCVTDCLYYYYQNDNSSSRQKSMRGDLTCQATMGAGIMILGFAESVSSRSKTLAENVCSAIPWFVNRLFAFLLRISHKEKQEFYKELSKLEHNNKSKFQSLCKYLNFRNRIIVKHPFLGIFLLDAMSGLYRLKHNND